MSTLLVSYDLKAPGRNYEALYDYLKGESNWWHNLESTWIVVTPKSPTLVRDEIKILVDSNDKLFVADITGRNSAWTGFSDTGSKWLKDNYDK